MTLDTNDNAIPILQLGNLILDLTPRKGELFRVFREDDPKREYTVLAPYFSVSGVHDSRFVFQQVVSERELPRGGRELNLRYETVAPPEKRLQLDVAIRSYPTSPFLRFRYRLTADAPMPLATFFGLDNAEPFRYFSLCGWRPNRMTLTTIQLSHFDPVAHSYLPAIQSFASGEITSGSSFPGPIAILEDGKQSLLVAYEHGADTPDSFLEFRPLMSGNEGWLKLTAKKGNFYNGQEIGPDKPLESVWFQIGLMAGGKDALLKRYRRFLLDEMAENVESRQPYVFYNTWNYQERRRYFDGRPYIESMTQERMLAEIEVAHRLGIDVFVIDTGWYGKTGDWLPNLDKFPDGLKSVKAKLDEYGMKLGLWFNPIVAAKTSKVYLEHPEYVMSRNGKPNYWGKIWETEESYGMCIASGYADHFIETMVRLHSELGVSYFKWDAIGQYGCDSASHDHGTADNSPEERADCYAYQMGRAMIRIVEEATKRCPGIIVDFDVTEGGRFVGLGFLSAGKYFLVNNGPYFHDFDIPKTVKMEPDTINVFFYPGPARSRICRTGVRFDSVVPSILFLTHYLPDGPALSQRNSLASLVLGGNGIWGDLCALTGDDVALISEGIADYKRVRHSVTRAYPRVIGFAGSSPEIHEKIETESGSGVVVFFTVAPGDVRARHAAARAKAGVNQRRGRLRDLARRSRSACGQTGAQ